jgi:hypothetical protein
MAPCLGQSERWDAISATRPAMSSWGSVPAPGRPCGACRLEFVCFLVTIELPTSIDASETAHRYGGMYGLKLLTLAVKCKAGGGFAPRRDGGCIASTPRSFHATLGAHL